MRNYNCVELDDFNTVSRVISLIIHLSDMLISIVIGAKCYLISKQVHDLLPFKESNPMKFVALVTLGGGLLNTIYFIESTECNFKLFFLLYGATYCISPFMFNYINQMIDFYDCDKFSVPFKECAYMKNKQRYRKRFHLILTTWYVAASTAEQVLQEFCSNTSVYNKFDYASTVIHSILNISCVYLAMHSVIACFRFQKYVITDGQEMKQLKQWQVSFTLTTSLSAVILHLVFVVISISATFNILRMNYEEVRVYTYLGFSVMNIVSHVLGLVLAKTFLKHASMASKLFEQDFVYKQTKQNMKEEIHLLKQEMKYEIIKGGSSD